MLAAPQLTTTARRRPRMRGDTLVEVLICILLISVILGGAYTTVRRSSIGIRNAQEHAEALKRAESQVEQIRANANSSNVTVYGVGSGQGFCMIDGTVVLLSNGAESGKCNQDSSGQPADSGVVYRINVKRTDQSGGRHLFTARVDWDAITGTPAQETIYYRLQQ